MIQAAKGLVSAFGIIPTWLILFPRGVCIKCSRVWQGAPPLGKQHCLACRTPGNLVAATGGQNSLKHHPRVRLLHRRGQVAGQLASAAERQQHKQQQEQRQFSNPMDLGASADSLPFCPVCCDLLGRYGGPSTLPCGG